MDYSFSKGITMGNPAGVRKKKRDKRRKREELRLALRAIKGQPATNESKPEGTK
jgi:hypothetical protein